MQSNGQVQGLTQRRAKRQASLYVAGRHEACPYLRGSTLAVYNLSTYNER